MSELCNKHRNCHIIFDKWDGCPICKMENLLKDTIQERDDLAEDIAEKENEIECLQGKISRLQITNNKKG